VNAIWTRRAIGCSSSVWVSAKFPQAEKLAVLVVCSMSSRSRSAEKVLVAAANRWLDSTPQETIVRTYRELAALVENGTLAAPVEATYALADYREAIGHAAQNDRHGKVLFTSQ
jgi:NADPH:quinone reductase-like Zn-dependent oxidoreductase